VWGRGGGRGAPVSHHGHVHERLVAYLGHVGDVERAPGLDEAVKVEARVATEARPSAVREVEAERLYEQYERHPLVVGQAARRSSASTAPSSVTQPLVGRDVGVERQEIRVADPTEAVQHITSTSPESAVVLVGSRGATPHHPLPVRNTLSSDRQYLSYGVCL